nr:hypothetical protein [uncultured Flavobacterium sp.]
MNKLFKNECGSIIKEVERTVYEASKQMLQSSTIMYKSGHKRRRAKNL